MKSIEIKTHETVKFTEEENLNTRHLIQMIINRLPNGGFTLKDIQERDRIEKAMKETKEGFPILLEDADHKNLEDLAKNMQWPVRDMFISEFVEDLKNAKSAKAMTMEELERKKAELNGVAELKPVV